MVEKHWSTFFSQLACGNLEHLPHFQGDEGNRKLVRKKATLNLKRLFLLFAGVPTRRNDIFVVRASSSNDIVALSTVNPVEILNMGVAKSILTSHLTIRAGIGTAVVVP